MRYAIAIHGGAGTILKSMMSESRQRHYEQELRIALRAGSGVLKQGGAALDAVTAAVVALEDCPLFNAGRGSVFSHDGKHEMDASVMDGKSTDAGAVASVQGVRNPVLLARKVMEASEHLLLAGKGAEAFARVNGIAFEHDDYFYDGFRYEQYQEALKADRVQLDHTSGDGKKMGTVGAVAWDSKGHLASATSTGGLTNKKFGRVGDSPIIGAGTYANDRTCAVSCTGVGELFIKESVAFQVHLLMQDAGKSLKEACDLVVKDRLVKINGEGGLIAIDHQGNIELSFNSAGMYRAWATPDTEEVAIYG